jgi:hypothetical protein
MATTFEQHIEKERERITKAREEALARRQKADDEIQAIERQLAAVNAYDSALRGELPKPPKAPRAPSSTRAPRGSLASKKLELLELIKGFPDGATAAVLNVELNATTTSEKQSVANALGALKKEGLITQAARRAPYKAI